MALDCTKITDKQSTWIVKGSKGEQVKEVQRLLQSFGYYKGYKVDGDFGNVTRNAVISFQKKHGTGTDGKVGPKTCAALNGQKAATTTTSNDNKPTGFDCPNTSLKRDQSNNAELVKKLQSGLQSIGYYKGYKVDGSYGTYTANAVAAFQRANGLSPDGWFGPKTCVVFNQKLGWSDAKTTTTKTTTTVTKKKAAEIVIDAAKANYLSETDPEINFTVDGVYFIATDINPNRSYESGDWQTIELLGDKSYTYLGHSQPIEYDITVKLPLEALNNMETALQQMQKKACKVTGKSIQSGNYVMTINKGFALGDWRTLSFHLLQYRG